MYPLGGVSFGPVNPNTVRRPDDGRPILFDRYCETCLVKWRGEVSETCWSCGGLPEEKK